MRKLLLLTALTIAGISSYSQQAVNQNVNWMQTMMEDKSRGVPQQNQNTTNNNTNSNRIGIGNNSRSVSNQVILNSQPIGTAGNLLTVLDDNSKQIDVNDTLNTVIFVHRNDPTPNTGTGVGNVAQYCYDASKNGGVSWTSNIGPITNSPLIDNVTVNGRFPQAGIYNPIGNSIPDSAFLIYSGTWHDAPPSGTSGNWEGQMRGRGNLSGDSTTFNVHIDVVNNGKVDVASGFCQSTPGVFWNLNQDFTGTFVTGSAQITYGLLVEKGVWDSTNRDINWTVQNIPQAFDSALNGTVYASEATSFNMAFDPSGQYGWLSCLGAINPLDSSLEPIFWQSVDSGNTWQGPIVVHLDSIPEVVNQLHTLDINGNPTSHIPTTAFDENIVVDYLGHPHMVVIVGNRAATEGYALTTGAGYTAWDITNCHNLAACGDTGWHGWTPIFLDSVETLRGTLTSDDVTQDNRPMASRSKDGKKLFFYWLDSDISVEGSDVNSNPNLFTRAFDLEHFTSTNVIDITVGDSLWGGVTATTPGGVINGVPFPTCAPVAHQVDSDYNVPFVFTQIDYTVPPGTLGLSTNPAAFWYINNINYDPYDFVNGLSASVSLNPGTTGTDSIILLNGQTYVEYGAQINYLDTACYASGPLHLVIDSSEVNSNIDGGYYVHYLAEDANGNVYASANREVTVGSPPVAFFTYTHSTHAYKIQFFDASLYNPNAWYWNFGDGNSSFGDYPDPLHVYTADTTYNVCLTVYNSFGSSDTCLPVVVTGLGISDLAFSENIALYPNPTNGKATLSISETTLSELSVTVLDMLGNNVIPESRYQAGTSKIEMDLSSLASGLYLVKVTCDQGTAIKYLNLSDTH